MSQRELTPSIFLYGPAAAAPVEPRDRPEAQLVERFCSGDVEAFDDIYRMYAPLVHGILLSRLPYDEVKDVMQEVFLAAYKSLPAIRDKNLVGAWLARIARNHAAEYYRRSQPTEELSEQISGRHNPSAEAVEILTAIKTLPETYRETLVLRLIEGMTGIEIADRTGLTPESVRVNLHRGMEQLRKKLGFQRV